MDFVQGLKSSYPNSSMLISLIGLLIVVKKVVSLLKKIRILTRKRMNLKQRYGKNSWAFLTGSSDGIGKQIALQLAKQGFNVIISARTLKKLEAVQQQITKKYPQRQVKIVTADYSLSHDRSYIESIMDKISDLDISIVVNNVGLDCLEYYHKQDPASIQKLLKVNCFPVAFFNRLFIPIMLKRNQQKRVKSAIINVASIAGQIPMPFHNIYSASKAYVDNLSQALAYQNPSIDILSLRPSEVSTPMTCNKDTDILTITAGDCARGVIDQLGYEKATYGHWRHQLQGWLYEIVPENFFNYIFAKFVAPEQMQRRMKNLKRS